MASRKAPRLLGALMRALCPAIPSPPPTWGSDSADAVPWALPTQCGNAKCLLTVGLRANVDFHKLRQADSAVRLMKDGIHPKYVETKVTCGCGNTFVTRSTHGRS